MNKDSTTPGGIKSKRRLVLYSTHPNTKPIVFNYYSFVKYDNDRPLLAFNIDDPHQLTVAAQRLYLKRELKVIPQDMIPTAEAIIATDGWASFNYARNIIRAPFPLGEEAIKNDTFWNLWDEYQEEHYT